MPRRTQSSPSKDLEGKKISAGKKINATKKTAKAKKIAAKAIKVKVAVTKTIETPAPTVEKKSDKKIVLDSIAKEEDLSIPSTSGNTAPAKPKPEFDQPKSIFLNKTVVSEKISDSEKIAPQQSFSKQAEPERLNKISKDKNIADEIYSAKSNDSPADKKIPNKGRSLGLYRKIALSFIVLTVLLLTVITYFTIAKVTIVLTPNQERVSSNLIIDVFDKDKKSAANEGEILGVVRQIEVEQSKTFPSSGIEVISEEVVGKVTLINTYNKNQPLVARTRLLSPDNKLFRIKKTVNVPAGGRIEVEVYADDPGQDMIIGPTSFTIPGLWAALQDKIYGESKKPMKYSRQVKKHIQQSDVDKGTKNLKQILLDKAKAEISENYQTYDQIIYDIDSNSISQQIDGRVGEEKDEFSISMKTIVAIVVFADDEIYNTAKQKLISVLPDNKQLTDFNKDDISYSLNSYNIHQGAASLDINFVGKMIIKQGASIIDRKMLTGLNRDQISVYLDSLPEIAGYDIKFYPSFIRKAPNLIDRIELVIN